MLQINQQYRYQTSFVIDRSIKILEKINKVYQILRNTQFKNQNEQCIIFNNVIENFIKHNNKFGLKKSFLIQYLHLNSEQKKDLDIDSAKSFFRIDLVSTMILYKIIDLDFLISNIFLDISDTNSYINNCIFNNNICTSKSKKMLTYLLNILVFLDVLIEAKTHQAQKFLYWISISFFVKNYFANHFDEDFATIYKNTQKQKKIFLNFIDKDDEILENCYEYTLLDLEELKAQNKAIAEMSSFLSISVDVLGIYTIDKFIENIFSILSIMLKETKYENINSCHENINNAFLIFFYMYKIIQVRIIHFMIYVEKAKNFVLQYQKDIANYAETNITNYIKKHLNYVNQSILKIKENYGMGFQNFVTNLNILISNLQKSYLIQSKDIDCIIFHLSINSDQAFKKIYSYANFLNTNNIEHMNKSIKKNMTYHTLSLKQINRLRKKYTKQEDTISQYENQIIKKIKK